MLLGSNDKCREEMKAIHCCPLCSFTATVRGNTVERLSYDPWGRRRNTTDFGYCNVSHTFDRGFTGHEHLYDFGLINMNGRMYDPITSSFLSVDQYVGSPENAQGFNRYAYCSNNPLRYVDPSGWLQVGGGASGYTPNSSANANDPYAYAEHGSLLEPRDVGKRQFDTSDPVITWMEGNEQHVGGNGGGQLSEPTQVADGEDPPKGVKVHSGEIELIPMGNDQYEIHFDTYDFNIEWDQRWSTRNIGTIISGFLHGPVIDNTPIPTHWMGGKPCFAQPSVYFGGPFEIHFSKSVYIKP